MTKADYYVRRGDTERGPTTAARIREMAAQGKLSKDDAIRRGEDGDWFRAGDLPGLFDGTGGADATGELIQDPLVNLAGKAAETAGKAAGLIGKAFGGAVKGIMARRTQEPDTPAVQPSATPPTPTVRIPPAELLVPAADSDETTLCPYCSEIIKRSARKCKHCGENLDVGLPVPHAQPNWPAQASPQSPPVIVIQNPTPPAQRPPNITINSPVNINNRSESRASARSRQKASATAVAMSVWSRPLSGCGCLSVMLAGVVGIIFLGILRSIVGPVPDKKTVPVPVARSNLTPPTPDASPKTQPLPNAEVNSLAKDETVPEIKTEPSGPDKTTEHRATSKLVSAKALLNDGKKDAAKRWLKEVVEQFPGTKAAEEAAELLKKRF